MFGSLIGNGEKLETWGFVFALRFLRVWDEDRKSFWLWGWLFEFNLKVYVQVA